MSTMDTIDTTFETTGPINLKVELRQGDVTLRATSTSTTKVRLMPHGKHGAELAENFTVEARGNDVVVIGPKMRDGFFGMTSKGTVDVEVELPEHSTVEVKTGSGDVTSDGVLGDVSSATGSGDLTFQDVASAALKSGSGDITARAVSRDLDAKTGSGDITVESIAEAAEVISGSGDITLRRTEAAVRAKSGSGDLTITASAGDLDIMTGTGDIKLGAVRGGTIKAKTGTGDVSIAVALGVAAYLDLNTVTGDVSIDLDDADGPEGSESQARLTVHSGSGDIRVLRAKGALS